MINTVALKKVAERVNRLKSSIDKIREEYMREVALWITNRANTYIDSLPIGSEVKDDIKKGWKYHYNAKSVKIINTSQKAVFVEFGVGVTGESSPHPNALSEGYKYNVPSYYKDAKGSGTWIFHSTLNSLDIPQFNANFIHDGNEYVVITKGAQASLYLYNALVDAKTDLQNPNGYLADKKRKIIERYIK